MWKQGNGETCGWWKIWVKCETGEVTWSTYCVRTAVSQFPSPKSGYSVIRGSYSTSRWLSACVTVMRLCCRATQLSIVSDRATWLKVVRGFDSTDVSSSWGWVRQEWRRWTSFRQCSWYDVPWIAARKTTCRACVRQKAWHVDAAWLLDYHARRDRSPFWVSCGEGICDLRQPW